MNEPEVTKQVSPDMERWAAQRVKGRPNAARCDLDVTIFLFGILAILRILFLRGLELA